MTQSTAVEILPRVLPDLATIADGAVCEAFGLELEKVLENIADPNTDPHAKREINIKVVLVPIGEEREEVRIGIQCSSKTVNHKPIETLFWLTATPDSIECRELRKKQTTLQDYGYQD